MNDCCNVDETATEETTGFRAKSHRCPVNGKLYARVHRKTLLHHILHPWDYTLTEQQYYFCTDPDCDVVYYGQDDSVIRTDELRTTIWQKSKDKRDAICYCFGVTKALAKLENIKKFVSRQTKNSMCSCETSNPSGRCCLKDFPDESF
jgi:hypothetical protein